MKINEILKELKSVDASGNRVRIKDIIGKPEPVQTVEPDDYEDYSAEVDVDEPTVDVDEPTVDVDEPTVDVDEPTVTSDPIDTEMEKVNANIKRKVDYLVKQGVLQSGRITDAEKQYIDSVDVYVDPNKFANTDPSEVYIQATPPHPSNYGASVTIPLSKWMEAQGRDGSPFTGYVGFNRTPAGWWTDDYKAYVNPRNDLDNLIASYRKK
jgi:hypothetical protein